MRASPITRMRSVDPDERVLSGLYCIALNFQSDFPNLIDLHAIFSQSQGPPAPGSERQENPCWVMSGFVSRCKQFHIYMCMSLYEWLTASLLFQSDNVHNLKT